eukprot:scaffold20466_cov73-Cylindrotheca_fusiformis.AAC.2
MENSYSVHPLNAWSPIPLTVDGMSTSFKDLQSTLGRGTVEWCFLVFMLFSGFSQKKLVLIIDGVQSDTKS